jgi:hypothetical protein
MAGDSLPNFRSRTGYAELLVFFAGGTAESLSTAAGALFKIAAFTGCGNDSGRNGPYRERPLL